MRTISATAQDFEWHKTARPLQLDILEFATKTAPIRWRSIMMCLG